MQRLIGIALFFCFLYALTHTEDPQPPSNPIEQNLRAAGVPPPVNAAEWSVKAVDMPLPTWAKDPCPHIERFKVFFKERSGYFTYMHPNVPYVGTWQCQKGDITKWYFTYCDSSYIHVWSYQTVGDTLPRDTFKVGTLMCGSN